MRLASRKLTRRKHLRQAYELKGHVAHGQENLSVAVLVAPSKQAMLDALDRLVSYASTDV